MLFFLHAKMIATIDWVIYNISIGQILPLYTNSGKRVFAPTLILHFPTILLFLRFACTLNHE